MATQEYWDEELGRILHPVYGSVVRLPVPDESIIGNAPSLSNRDVVCLLAHGRVEAAYQILDDFLERLASRATDFGWLTEIERQKRPPIQASVCEDYLVSTWLRHGAINPEAAQRALQAQLQLAEYWGPTPGTPWLLHSMLAAIESGQLEMADSLYREHEPTPLGELPSGLRASQNPRHVLWLFVEFGGAAEHVSQLMKLLERLAGRASKWERSVQPVPYVGSVELARIVRSALELAGLDSTVQKVAEWVK